MTIRMMKKILFIMIFSISISVCGEAASSGEWNVGLDMNYVTPQGKLDDRFQSEFGFGLNSEFQYGKYFGLFCGGQYQEFSRHRNSLPDNLMVIDFLLDGTAGYPIGENWKAFLQGGMGIYFSHNEAWWMNGESRESFDLGYNYGCGLTYQVSKSIGISGRLITHNFKLNDESEHIRWLDMTLGVRLGF
jgi:opacity protein-like surface antigen